MRNDQIVKLHTRLKLRLQKWKDTPLNEMTELFLKESSGWSAAVIGQYAHWNHDCHSSWLKVTTRNKFLVKDVEEVLVGFCQEQNLQFEFERSWSWEPNAKFFYGGKTRYFTDKKDVYEFFITNRSVISSVVSKSKEVQNICLSEDPTSDFCPRALVNQVGGQIFGLIAEKGHFLSSNMYSRFGHFAATASPHVAIATYQLYSGTAAKVRSWTESEADQILMYIEYATATEDEISEEIERYAASGISSIQPSLLKERNSGYYQLLV